MSAQSVLKWPMPDWPASFEMPADAQVIDVQAQGDVPTLWTLGTDDGRRKRRTFVGFATGQPITEIGLKYVGSAHGIGGWMVFHLFEQSLEADGPS